jgi:hypothetical protein
MRGQWHRLRAKETEVYSATSACTHDPPSPSIVDVMLVLSAMRDVEDVVMGEADAGPWIRLSII